MSGANVIYLTPMVMGGLATVLGGGLDSFGSGKRTQTSETPALDSLLYAMGRPDPQAKQGIRVCRNREEIEGILTAKRARAEEAADDNARTSNDANVTLTA